MSIIRLTSLECTLVLSGEPSEVLPYGYRIERPPMPTRRRVSIEEFEADMRAALAAGER